MKLRERRKHQRQMVRTMALNGFSRHEIAASTGIHPATVSQMASATIINATRKCEVCGALAVDKYRKEWLCATCLTAPGDPNYEERQREFYTRRSSSLAAMQEHAPDTAGTTAKTKFGRILDERMAKKGIKIDRGIVFGRAVE